MIATLIACVSVLFIVVGVLGYLHFDLRGDHALLHRCHNMLVEQVNEARRNLADEKHARQTLEKRCCETIGDLQRNAVEAAGIRHKHSAAISAIAQRVSDLSEGRNRVHRRRQSADA